MNATITHASALQGTVTVDPDKAICQRAVLLGALADGTTRIHPWPSADDCQHALRVIQQLGVSVSRFPQGISIHGRGARGWRAPAAELCCGESGTTFRLVAGLLAGQPFTSTLSAGPALSGRPMQRIIEPLSRMGAVLTGRSGRCGECYPPLTIQGRSALTAIRYTLPVASAQVKSAVLLAGLSADGPTSVIEPRPTRDHTERLLRGFGVLVRADAAAVTVEPGPLTSPGEVSLPADFSSAAFFIVAALCVPGSRLVLPQVNLNPTRIGLLKILERMGARVRLTDQEDGWEPRATVEVHAQPLHAARVEAAEVPSVIDELPILMVAAACARGTTRFDGVGELRVKETDRIESMLNGLRRLGIQASLVAPDTVEIEGGLLTGAAVESVGDHRTAMSLAVAGLVAQGVTTVLGAECVAKSFPEFFDRLREAAGPATVKSVDKAEGLC